MIGYLNALRRAGIVAVLAAFPVVAIGQVQPRDPKIEADLLALLAQQSNEIQAHLDLARTYLDQKRFQDAERLLLRAASLARQEWLKSQPTLVNPPGGQLQAPLRVGGHIAEPKKIKDVRPVYPEIARAAAVQGVVILEIVVDTSGNVRDARVVRSIPLLDQSALDAVRQWRFTPTVLNLVPVEVVMTVTVNFIL